MELYVLGPAFGLPSIDAECIAAVALMRQSFGHHSNPWSLIPCQTQPDRLPLLRDECEEFSGFHSIARRLAGLLPSLSTSSLKADGIAIEALLQARAPPLISAYLYVSAENYTNATRGAYTPILSPLARFVLPPNLRATARDSTSHLGISAMDVDTTHDAPALDANDSSFEAAASRRTSLILPTKRGVKSLLARKAEGQTTFRLHALADALFEPLQSMLGEKTWLLDDATPCYVDCLAFGYLSLMLEAGVPSKWLFHILNDRYPVLTAYVRRCQSAWHLEADSADLTLTNKAGKSLPWKTLPMSTADHFDTTRQAVESLLPSLRSAPISSDGQINSSIGYGVIGTLLALAVPAYYAGNWLVQETSAVKHGERVQIFGQKNPMAGLDHVSLALAPFNFNGPK